VQLSVRIKSNSSKRLPIVFMSLAIALAVITVSLAYQSNSLPVSSSNSNLPGLVADASLFGNQVSLTQAHSLAKFSFRTPSFLPAGTSLDKVYVSNDGTIVRLFYNNSNLPDAAAFGGSIPFPAQIVIYAEASPTNPIPQFVSNEIPPIIIQAHNVNGASEITETISQGLGGNAVLVCGQQGYGVDQTGGQAATLTWWTNGVQYILTAKLSLSTLSSIAGSMC
jgi:hypothetical protein